MKPQDVNPELMTLLDNELLTDEDLKWVGQPDPLQMALKQVASLVGGLIWLFFCAIFFGFWFSGFTRGFPITETPMPFFFYLFPLIFIGTGLVMILQPLIHYGMALRTIYAITNRRILTLKRHWNTQIVSYGKKDMERLERRDKSGGKGDIIIGYEQRVRRTKNRTRYYTVPIGLFGVENVRQVEVIILETFYSDAGYNDEKPKRLSVFDYDDDQALYQDKYGR